VHQLVNKNSDSIFCFIFGNVTEQEVRLLAGSRTQRLEISRHMNNYFSKLVWFSTPRRIISQVWWLWSVIQSN